MAEILVPAERIPVVLEADICVVGGSCTGVFAAVRAARLGARVALVELQNRFGGVATLGLVGMWHHIYDIDFAEQVIGGLTVEMMERLARRGAASDFRSRESMRGVRINPEELTLELDALVAEHRIVPLLCTRFCRAVKSDEGTIEAVLVENKSGRGAIRAKVFVDASGDGDLAASAGLAMRLPARRQPPTACARLEGWRTIGKTDLYALIRKRRDRHPDLPGGYHWGCHLPGSDIYMLAGTRLLNADLLSAEGLTRAEMASRRQIRALLDLIREEIPAAKVTLVALPAAIGIRETRHIEALHRLTGEELLRGEAFPDAIANGTYPVDIHSDTDESITFLRLDGTRQTFRGNRLTESSRWLPEGAEHARFYRIPLRSLIPGGARNLIVAGRMLDADQEAFGAVRVMVNLNQTGEAAGVAAWQALNGGRAMTEIDPAETRRLLARGGSIVK